MLKYNDKEHKFIYEKDDFQAEIPFLYNDKSSDGKLFDKSLFQNYTIIELYNTVIRKEHICEIVVKDRIGMLVPFTSIINKVSSPTIRVLHEWYLFLATAHYTINKNRIEEDSNSEIKCFLILDNSKMELEFGSKFEVIQWGLVSYNFFLKAERYNSLLNSSMDGKKKISLEICSPYLSKNMYVRTYFKDYIYETDLIKRFLYTYQIIEMLLDDVLIESLHNNILKCQEGNLSLRSNIDNLTEIARLNIILDKIGRSSNANFNAACIDLLKKSGRDTSLINKFPDSLYQIRNCIVHRLRYIVNTSLEQDLAIINDYFELFIINVLGAYNKNTSLNIDDHLWFYKNMKK